jgi:hypothetical protein
MRPIWWPKLIPHNEKHKLYRKNLADFLFEHFPADQRSSGWTTSCSLTPSGVNVDLHAFSALWQVSCKVAVAHELCPLETKWVTG